MAQSHTLTCAALYGQKNAALLQPGPTAISHPFPTRLWNGQKAAQATDITVAYFLEWPLSFEKAKVEGLFDKELGAKVNWRSFDTGVAMSAAMAAGDVQIAVSQGIPPFINAASAGQDLKIVDVAVSYSENDNCVVRSDLEITRDNATELNGTRVGVPHRRCQLGRARDRRQRPRHRRPTDHRLSGGRQFQHVRRLQPLPRQGRAVGGAPRLSRAYSRNAAYLR